jgi:DNA-binding NarL/FixJ family response regulator
LLGDDDAWNRVVLRQLLEDEDILVVGEAGDGPTAVKLAQSLDPDVVLMALRTSPMGELEATQKIRESRPHLQVLILTEYQEGPRTLSAEEAGAYAYLVKGCGSTLIWDVVMQAKRFKAALEEQSRRDGAKGHRVPR